MPITGSSLAPAVPLIPSSLSSGKSLGLLKALPFGLGFFTIFDHLGYEGKFCMHEEIGNAFAVDTPTGNMLYLSSAEAVDEAMSRRNDFPKPVQIYGR